MPPCPTCGQTAPDQPAGRTDEHMVVLTRVASVAEAGFLADQLIAAGYNSRVEPAESFDAITGGWSIRYAVLTAADDAPEAATHLRDLLAAEGPTERPVGAQGFGVANPWLGGIVLATAVAAGLVATRPHAGPPPPGVNAEHPGTTDALLKRLQTIGQRFEAIDEDGKRHRLEYVHRQRAWRLTTDADGDGAADRVRLYTTTVPPADAAVVNR